MCLCEFKTGRNCKWRKAKITWGKNNPFIQWSVIGNSSSSVVHPSVDIIPSYIILKSKCVENFLVFCNAFSFSNFYEWYFHRYLKWKHINLPSSRLCHVLMYYIFNRIRTARLLFYKKPLILQVSVFNVIWYIYCDFVSDLPYEEKSCIVLDVFASNAVIIHDFLNSTINHLVWRMFASLWEFFFFKKIIKYNLCSNKCMNA